MRPLTICVILLSLCCSCKDDSSKSADQLAFDIAKWSQKENDLYKYRSQMADEVLYNDTIRSLNRLQLVSLLGTADKEVDNHLYYELDRKKLGFWTLEASFLVVKFKDSITVEWIKIHNP